MAKVGVVCRAMTDPSLRKPAPLSVVPPTSTATTPWWAESKRLTGGLQGGGEASSYRSRLLFPGPGGSVDPGRRECLLERELNRSTDAGGGRVLDRADLEI